MIVVLRAPSLSTHVREAGRAAAPADQRRWTRAAYASQRAVLKRLTAAGVVIRPEFRYARVLNSFAAPLDGGALALLEADPAVAGVYPVRAAYPAGGLDPAHAATDGLAGWTGASLPDFRGRGVKIALLDTGVDLSHPWLAPHVTDGVDLVGRSPTADAKSSPDDPTEVEAHGTAVASVVLRAAPEATIVPLRVAGWQRDVNRRWVVFARTDQILAGLERAVDLNSDGDAADAARVALVALAEPFAAFADDPLARACAGAEGLGTLVVAPAGHDGPAEAVFGSVGGPGAARTALTVGAVDLRPRARRVHVILRTGLETILDRSLPLAGEVGPLRSIHIELAWVGGRPGTTPAPSDFFDPHGYSRVAGKAALIAGTGSVELAAERAARAGAVAVLLYGSGPPPGALGATAGLSIPVVTLPPELGPALAVAVRRGARVPVTLGPTRTVANASIGRLASFSSRGLVFAGRLKPDLVAPGVGIVAAAPGVTESGGAPAFATLNGSSAAAALVAGAAAVLGDARPALDAERIKSVLVGSARPVADDPLAAQGGGLVDLGAAAAQEVAAFPSTLTLGPVSRAGAVTSHVVIRNVSTRDLTLYVAGGAPSGSRPVAVRVAPTRLELPTGEAVTLRVRALVRRLPPFLGTLQGSIRVTPVGGERMRIAWIVAMRPTRLALLGPVRVSTHSFAPSDASPAVLTFQAGRVLQGDGGPSVQPLSRLDVELWDETETRPSRLGLLARFRDVLPGRYAIGLTGRAPHGKVLHRGRYRVRLIAFPTIRALPTRRSVVF